MHLVFFSEEILKRYPVFGKNKVTWDFHSLKSLQLPSSTRQKDPEKLIDPHPYSSLNDMLLHGILFGKLSLLNFPDGNDSFTSANSPVYSPIVREEMKLVNSRRGFIVSQFHSAASMWDMTFLHAIWSMLMIEWFLP